MRFSMSVDFDTLQFQKSNINHHFFILLQKNLNMSNNNTSLAKAMFGMKCPKCRQGDLFETPTLSFKKPFDMPDHCDVCGQKFEPEPGFYFGSMFISYIMTAFFSLIVIGLCIFVFDLSINMSLLILVLLMVVLFIWVFRFSRSVWINLMVKYDPNSKK